MDSTNGYSAVSTREMISNGMGKSQLTSTGDSTLNIWDQNRKYAWGHPCNWLLLSFSLTLTAQIWI
jgi:hypothetical protein